MSWEKDLQSYAEQTQQDSPTAVEAQALVARARRQTVTSRRPTRWVLVTAATAALIAFLLPGDPTPIDQPAVATQVVAEVAQEPSAVKPEVLGVGRTVLSNDVVDVAEDGQVTVIAQAAMSGTDGHTRLRLDRGSARFDVGKRTAGASFTVEAQAYKIRVIGTAFEVVRSPFSVVVSEGVVEVLEGLNRWKLRAGERFEGGRVHHAPQVEPAPPIPELDALRRLVLGGQLGEARAGVGERMNADPSDMDACILGAQIETKLGDREAAVALWERAAAKGNSAQVQRAHYEAAVLLTGEPARAEAHLRAFLKTGGPLMADARLRLGRALRAQGKAAQAQQAHREEGAQAGQGKIIF